MTARLALKPQSAFAQLSLHEKNAYLQDLASRFCALTGRPAIDLDKDALSRLRRFYSRRRLSDLNADTLPQDALGEALRSLAEAIKDKEIGEDVLGGLKAELPAPAPILRAAPADDAQLMFFVPAIYDASIKDDVNLMDVAPFSISKNRRTGTIRYELKDSVITITASTEYGMATVWDYDIFLHMVSHLAEEFRAYKVNRDKGVRVNPPARVYRPNAVHILKFARRGDGRKSYKDLEAALDRLRTTQIKIVNLSGGKRREAIGVPLIQSYRVVTTTTTGHIDEIEIGIPEWVYANVVREKGPPHILTINPNYFLISEGLGRMVYRLARKAAGKGVAKYSLSTVHRHCGSTQAMPQFAQMLKRFVANTKVFPFPDYDLEIVPGTREPVLQMRYREGEGGDEVTTEPLPLIDG